MYTGNSPTNFIDPLGLEKKDRNKDCRDFILRNTFPSIGNFMADTAVPDFSAVSLFTNTKSFLATTAISEGSKGLFYGAPWLLGKYNTTIGNNLTAYPGMAGAAADALEKGAWWANTSSLVLKVFEGAGLFGGFATGADLGARWLCRDVQ